jgi:hypothetical protein
VLRFGTENVTQRSTIRGVLCKRDSMLFPIRTGSSATSQGSFVSMSTSDRSLQFSGLFVLRAATS